MSKEKFSKKSRHFWRNIKLALKNPVTYIYFIIVLLLIAGTIVVKYVEPTHPDNEIAQGWKDAIWHTIVAVVAAYYDFYMKTTPGRLASLILLLFGMAFWAIVTGKITTWIINAQNKDIKGIKKIRRMKGHFLVCGWRPGFDKILDTVMKTNPEITSDQIVIVNNAPTEQIVLLRVDLRFKDIKYVSGDFSDADTLKRAYIDSADRVLVISDRSNQNSNDSDIDSKTVLSVITVKNLNPKAYVAAELLDSKLEVHLKLAHCDEIILTQEYEHSLLATASSGKGYSNVIKSLISDDDDSGVIINDIPASYIGKKYQLFSDFYEEKTDDGEVLIGLLLDENHETKLTPKEDFIIPPKAKAILIKAN